MGPTRMHQTPLNLENRLWDLYKCVCYKKQNSHALEAEKAFDQNLKNSLLFPSHMSTPFFGYPALTYVCFPAQTHFLGRK